MPSLWGVYVPAGAEEFPGPAALRSQLRQCRCGQMTFLPLPCRNCGAQSSPPAFRRALRRAWTRRLGRWAFAAVYLAAAAWAARLIWAPLIWPAIGVTLAALAADLLRSTSEKDICFWLFHTRAGGKGKLPPADAEAIEALTDAYDTDLQRLERLLESDPSPECAERVFRMTQDLAGLFHNRQTSALLAKCLTALRLSEGICVDLDQVCAWLEPEDLSFAALKKLAECARFTCLPAGAPTARFVVRFCAFRVQQTLETCCIPKHFRIEYIPALISHDDAFLGALNLSQEEHGWLSALWNLAAVFSVPPSSPEGSALAYYGQMHLAEVPAGSGYVADFLFQYMWYQPGCTVFQKLDNLLRDELGTALKEKWRRGAAYVES